MTDQENKPKEDKNKKNIFLPPTPRIVLRKKQNNRIEDSFSPGRKIVLAKRNPAVTNTNYNKELGDFLSNKAVLEKLQDGQYYWVLYDTRRGQRIGPVEKATPEELTGWNPKVDEKH